MPGRVVFGRRPCAGGPSSRRVVLPLRAVAGPVAASERAALHSGSDNLLPMPATDPVAAPERAALHRGQAWGLAIDGQAVSPPLSGPPFMEAPAAGRLAPGRCRRRP